MLIINDLGEAGYFYLIEAQPSFLERHIPVVADDDVVYHLDPQQLPRFDAVAGDDDVFRRW